MIVYQMKHNNSSAVCCLCKVCSFREELTDESVGILFAPRCEEEYVSSSFVLTPQQDFAFSYSAPVHVPTRSRVHGLFVRSLLGVALNFIIHPIQNFHIDGFHAIIRVIILSKG